jgi:16S rRNA (guanine966-N2)-methyltransferase
MKDRVREAVFNLLGPEIKGTHAVDLFAGTGALGFEALSRGAAFATFIERHFPTAAIVRENAAALECSDVTAVVGADTFFWAREPSLPADRRWCVFCSPPYDLYVERGEAMRGLIAGLLQASPAGSMFVVEADERFDFGRLPHSDQWQIREYPPARIAIYRKPADS